MAKQTVDFLTPVGRIVEGDVFEPQTEDAEGRPRRDRDGNPSKQWYIGLAIAKTDPGWPALQAKIYGEAQRGFPHLVVNGQIPAGFSIKIVDGDSTVPNQRGTRWCDKVGFPGNYILRMSSGFAPECYTEGGAERIIDSERIKKGYYVRVYGSVVSNDQVTKPGVYINLRMVELIGYGDEIHTGPSGKDVFGAAKVYSLPNGASNIPIAPQSTIQQPPPPPMAAPLPPPPLPPPAQDFLNPVVKYRTADGGTWTKEQLLAAGYSEAQVNALPKA